MRWQDERSIWRLFGEFKFTNCEFALLGARAILDNGLWPHFNWDQC